MPAPDFSDVTWRKSSRSNGGGGACVEVAQVTDATGVRDSKLGEASPILALTNEAWTAFLSEVKSGRLDRDQ